MAGGYVNHNPPTTYIHFWYGGFGKGVEELWLVFMTGDFQQVSGPVIVHRQNLAHAPPVRGFDLKPDQIFKIKLILVRLRHISAADIEFFPGQFLCLFAGVYVLTLNSKSVFYGPVRDRDQKRHPLLIQQGAIAKNILRHFGKGFHLHLASHPERACALADTDAFCVRFFQSHSLMVRVPDQVREP